MGCCTIRNYLWKKSINGGAPEITYNSRESKFVQRTFSLSGIARDRSKGYLMKTSWAVLGTALSKCLCWAVWGLPGLLHAGTPANLLFTGSSPGVCVHLGSSDNPSKVCISAQGRGHLRWLNGRLGRTGELASSCLHLLGSRFSFLFLQISGSLWKVMTTENLEDLIFGSGQSFKHLILANSGTVKSLRSSQDLCVWCY